MAITLHPDGGFILTKLVAGGQLETRLTWRQHSDGTAVEIFGGGHGTSLVAMLVDLLGGGLQVEFDQSLLSADPGCTPGTVEDMLRKQIGALSADVIGLAANLGVLVTGGDTFRFDNAKYALSQIAKIAAQSKNPGRTGIDRTEAGGQVDEAAQRWASLSGEVLDLAVQLGVPVDGVPLGDVLASMKQVIGQAQTAELRPLDDKGPPSPFKDEPQPTSSDPLLGETKPATIAGVQVAEAPPEQPRRKRRTREQIAADEAAEAAKKAATQQPAAVPAQPTTPDPVATAAFQADMAALSGKIDELPKVSLVEVKPPAAAAPVEQRVEPTGDPLDEMVDLLASLGQYKGSPPMPADLHPLDSKRNASDQQYLDTAQIRLYFGYPLVEEYAKDPKFKPGNPPAPGVNLRTDEGVVAAVQWMAKIHERAGQRGVAIPQLDLFFGLGTLEEVIEASVLKVRARREAQAAALQGRR